MEKKMTNLYFIVLTCDDGFQMKVESREFTVAETDKQYKRVREVTLGNWGDTGYKDVIRKDEIGKVQVSWGSMYMYSTNPETDKAKFIDIVLSRYEEHLESAKKDVVATEKRIKNIEKLRGERI